MKRFFCCIFFCIIFLQSLISQEKREGIPSIQVISPLAKSSFPAFLFCQVRISSELKKIDFFLKGYPSGKGKLLQEKDIYSYEWKDLSDGLYTIIVEATDTLGNKNTIEIPSQVDSTNPILEWSEPTGDYLASKNVSLYIHVLDDSPVTDVCYSVVDQKEKNCIPFQQEEKIWKAEFVVPEEGKYVLVAQARDSAGNRGKSKPIEIVYDITPPLVEFRYPEKKYLPGTFPLEIKAKDALSGIKLVELWIEEKKVPLYQEGDTWKASITIEKSGTYHFTPFVLDKAGNQAKCDSVKLHIDKDAPEVSLITPDPCIVLDTMKIAIECKDSISSLDETVLLLDKTVLGHWKNPQQNTDITLDLRSFSEGIYSLVAEARDQAGNTGQSRSVSLVIDRSAPQWNARITPGFLQTGIVKIELDIKDTLSGLPQNLSLRVWMELAGKAYPISCQYNKGNTWQAQCMITREHPEGDAIVYAEGIQDKAGHFLPKTRLGSFVIRAAGGLWPLSPRDKAHPLLAAFSQETSEKLSGLWISARAESEIFAIEDGQIVEIQSSLKEKSGYVLVQRQRDDFVWGYYHLMLGINPSTGFFWTPGDIIKEGQILGKAAKVQGIPDSFLYLELLAWKEGQWQIVAIPENTLSPAPGTERVSPLALVLAREDAQENQRAWNFFLPPEYQSLEIPSNSYAVSDFFILLYIIASVGAILVMIFWA